MCQSETADLSYFWYQWVCLISAKINIYLQYTIIKDRFECHHTFSRLGGRFAAAGHTGGWELVAWSDHGLRPFQPHAPPEQLAENMMRISHRAVAERPFWTFNGNIWEQMNGRRSTTHEKRFSIFSFDASLLTKRSQSPCDNFIIDSGVVESFCFDY